MGKRERGAAGLRSLLRALLAWCAAAAVLLVGAAWILAGSDTGSEAIGYVSSGISFLCAAAAGALAVGKGDRLLLTCFVTAVALLILLLTVGFLIRGADLNPSGILSVVTFTVAGVFFGGVFLRKKKKKPGKRSFSGLAGKARSYHNIFS